MGSQWHNFLLNLGEWHGSFTQLDAQGAIGESTASILSLIQGDEERLVHFSLRRFGQGLDNAPTREISQDYRSLGRQVVFFDGGSFSKGTLQVAPGSTFGAEFGFIDADRRHRLVVLHNNEGCFESAVLIREVRAGSAACERPPLTIQDLLGDWTGAAATIQAEWPEPDTSTGSLQVAPGRGTPLEIRWRCGDLEEVSGAATHRLLPLPDSGYLLVPLQVSHRAPFALEAGWLPEPGRLERLVRRYDGSGAWRSATWIRATRA